MAQGNVDVALSKGRVVRLTTTDDVGHQVEDFRFVECGQKPFGHRRNFRHFDALDFSAVDVDSLVRVGEIGVQCDRIAIEVHHNATDRIVVLHGHDDGSELITDLLAWMENMVD
jgi:hypothetical protein